MKQFVCVLDVLVDQYLKRQRALGREYNSEEWMLRSLSRFLRDQHSKDLEQAGFDAWCHSFVHLTANVRRQRQRVVRNFCLYRRRTESNCFVPDINRFPRATPYISPVIFAAAGVSGRSQAAAHSRPAPSSPLLPVVMRPASVRLP